MFGVGVDTDETEVAYGVDDGGTEVGLGIGVGVGAITGVGIGVGDGVTVGVGDGSGHCGSAVEPGCMGSTVAVGSGVAMTTVMRGVFWKSERQSSRQFWEMSGRSALIAR